MPQEKVRTRVTVRSPYGTIHGVEANIPRGFKFTPEFTERWVLELMRSGVIKPNPEEVKRNILRTLTTLKPADRNSWLRGLENLSAIEGPLSEPSVDLTFDSKELGFVVGSGIDPITGAMVPMEKSLTVRLTPSRASQIMKSAEALHTAYIMDEVESKLPQRNQVAPHATVLTGRAEKVRPIYSPHLPAAQQAAARHGVPVDVFLALVTQESGWKPDVVSHAGAIGLGQLMPGTAKSLGVNPLDPQQNLDGAARYLRKQFDAFGSWDIALAAYNAGPARIKKGKDGNWQIPNIRETQDYVKKVMALAPQMPTDITPGALREQARVMAQQQAQLAPDLPPDKNAAIVHARLAKLGYTFRPPVEPFVPGIHRLDYTDHNSRVQQVLKTLEGKSPAITALAEKGFRHDFGYEDFLRSPYIETPLGRVNVPSLETLNNILAPTDDPVKNAAILALTVTRVGVPIRGAVSAYRAATAAQKPFMSAIGAALWGATRAEVQTLGRFDATLAIAQATPSIALGKGLTREDLVNGALNMAPFVNLYAPGLGEAFTRNGVTGAIDWDRAPSWLGGEWGKSILNFLAPTFEESDTLVMLPAMGLAGRFATKNTDAYARIGVDDGDLVAVSHVPSEPAKAVELPSAEDTPGFRRPTATDVRPLVEELPRGYSVRRDTPQEIRPFGVEPGASKEVDTGSGKQRVAVAVSEKTSTGVPIGYRYLRNATESEFDLNARQIGERGEAAVYTNDKSVAALKSADRGYVATAEPRRMADGSVEMVPIVYRVARKGKKQQVYRLSEIWENPRLLERAARARGFDNTQDFIRAMQESPPPIEIERPAQGQEPVVGGKRRSALEEDGYFIFVDDFQYRVKIQETGNEVVDGALRIAQRAYEWGADIRDRAAVEAFAREVGASQESVQYLRDADLVTVTDDGAIVVRHNPNPERVDVDVMDAIHQGIRVDAGAAVLLGKTGVVEGRRVRMTDAEAEAVARDAQRERGCP